MQAGEQLHGPSGLIVSESGDVFQFVWRKEARLEPPGKACGSSSSMPSKSKKGGNQSLVESNPKGCHRGRTTWTNPLQAAATTSATVITVKASPRRAQCATTFRSVMEAFPCEPTWGQIQKKFSGLCSKHCLCTNPRLAEC